MFGRKPEPFSVQVLTSDYLIEGYVPPNLAWHNPMVLDVADAHYQPTGGSSLQAGAAPLLHIHQNAIAAIIPHDEASVVDLVKGFSNQHPFSVTILLEHYRIRGTAFGSSNTLRTITFMDAIFMKDIHIDSVMAGAQLTDLKAVYALIYPRKMLQTIFES